VVERDDACAARRQPAHNAAQIPHRLRGGEDVQQARLAGARAQRHRRPLRRFAAADGAERRRHREADGGRAVIGERGLRVPVAPVAVEEAGLRLDERRIVALRSLRDLQRLAVDLLRVETARVHDGERQVGTAQHRRGQVHDEAVLVADAQEEESSEPVAVDRAHVQR
jgi:hypothetical protein